jgi:hypothetical protein
LIFARSFDFLPQPIGKKSGKNLARKHKTGTIKKTLNPDWVKETEVRWEFDLKTLQLAGVCVCVCPRVFV